MFKKAISIFLIPVVMLCSTGITIFADYCPMKKELTYSLLNEKSCCCNKSMEDKCCTETKIVIEKIEDDYFSSQAQHIPQQLDFALVEYPPFAEQLFSNPVYQDKLIKDSHPPGPSVSRSILFRSILV